MLLSGASPCRRASGYGLTRLGALVRQALPQLLLAYALLFVIDSAYRCHDLLRIQSSFRKLHADDDEAGQPLDLDVFASAPAAAGFAVNAVAAFVVVCWLARVHLPQRSCYGGDARLGRLCVALDAVSFSLIAWTSLAALCLCVVASCCCCSPAALAPPDDAAHQEQARYEDESVVLVPVHSPGRRQYTGACVERASARARMWLAYCIHVHKHDQDCVWGGDCVRAHAHKFMLTCLHACMLTHTHTCATRTSRKCTHVHHASTHTRTCAHAHVSLSLTHSLATGPASNSFNTFSLSLSLSLSLARARSFSPQGRDQTRLAH